MITLQNIYKYFDSKFQRNFILKDINLEVSEGDFISIMGPSGAGKSTLLNIIGLIDEPSEGEYYFFEKPVHNLKEKQRTDYHRNYIGFIFQAYHLIEELNVYENIETPLIYKGIKTKERQSIIADLLDRFNMVAKRDLFPQQLSGGQQQLVGIARAIAGKPSLLLADEPTGNLHTDQGRIIMNLLKKLNQEGMTIIQVTHNEEFAKYAHRIIRLEDGMIKKVSEKNRKEATSNPMEAL
jgi:putative ABC transport system ATP-binding protein